MAEGTFSRVHVLFISAAVAEGRVLRQGYLLWLYCEEISRIVFTKRLLLDISMKFSKSGDNS